MCALASRFSLHPQIIKDVNPNQKYLLGETFYIKARRLAQDLIDVPDLSTVQGLLLLGCYSRSSGKSSGWMFSSMGIMIAINIKLNIDPDDLNLQLSWMEKEQRRRTWWICRLVDWTTAIMFDRVPVIQTPSNVQPPIPSRLWEYIRRDPGNNIPTNTINFTGTYEDPVYATICLMEIFYEIYNAASFFKNARGDLNQIKGPLYEAYQQYMQKIPELQMKLTNWFSALPTWFSNPGLVFVPELQSTRPPSYFVAYGLILFHTARVLLNRPLMMRSAKFCPRSTRSSVHWQQCTDAANQVAILLGAILPSNPQLHHLHPFTLYCIYQTALVHALNAQLGPAVSEEINFKSLESEVLEMLPCFGENPRIDSIEDWWGKSVVYLSLHVKAVQGMTVLWFPARRHLVSLKQLIDLAKLTELIKVTYPGDIEIEDDSTGIIEDNLVLPENFEPEAIEIEKRQAELQKIASENERIAKSLSESYSYEMGNYGDYGQVISSVVAAMAGPQYFDQLQNQLS
ncbi:hypothetical protein HK096_002628, partial [Nowakowskiella sp. JEL0078]